MAGGRLGRAFVLLLQEAHRDSSERASSDRLDITDVARTLGLSLVYAPSMRSETEEHADRGNAVLASVALEEVAVVELPFERQRRVAVLVNIGGHSAVGTPWRLTLASVHLDTGWMIRRGGAAAARRRQAQALETVLTSYSSPTVIGGDLNTSWEGDEPAAEELRTMFPDARPLNGPTWDGPLGLRRKLDYLFARLPSGHLEVSRADDRFGSDHYPLVGVLRTAQMVRRGWKNQTFVARVSR